MQMPLVVIINSKYFIFMTKTYIYLYLAGDFFPVIALAPSTYNWYIPYHFCYKSGCQ